MPTIPFHQTALPLSALIQWLQTEDPELKEKSEVALFGFAYGAEPGDVYVNSVLEAYEEALTTGEDPCVRGFAVARLRRRVQALEKKLLKEELRNLAGALQLKSECDLLCLWKQLQQLEAAQLEMSTSNEMCSG
jgi:hypothetical protein